MTEDHRSIRDLLIAAFGSEEQALLVDRIRSSPQQVSEMALVAELDREIVGHVMVSHATIESEGGTRRISMLSPPAVLPGRQRAGTGSRLVRAVLAVADSRSEPLVVLEGDPAYLRAPRFRALGEVWHHDPSAPLGAARSSAGQAPQRMGSRRPEHAGHRGPPSCLPWPDVAALGAARPAPCHGDNRLVVVDDGPGI
ncbi:MAG: GNAT family N-acetyltransferase [Iamia sp.]